MTDAGCLYEAGWATVAWDEEYSYWQVNPYSYYEIKAIPTHWMPLPAPPEALAKEEQE